MTAVSAPGPSWALLAEVRAPVGNRSIRGSENRCGNPRYGEVTLDLDSRLTIGTGVRAGVQRGGGRGVTGISGRAEAAAGVWQRAAV